MNRISKFIGQTIIPSGIRGFATGTDSVFTHPSLIRVGENSRPERVRVEPLSAMHSGDGLTVVLNGPNVFDEISMIRFARTLERTAATRARRG